MWEEARSVYTAHLYKLVTLGILHKMGAYKELKLKAGGQGHG